MADARRPEIVAIARIGPVWSRSGPGFCTDLVRKEEALQWLSRVYRAMGYRDVVVTYVKATDPNSRLDSPLRPKTLCEVWRYLFRDKRVRRTRQPKTPIQMLRAALQERPSRSSVEPPQEERGALNGGQRPPSPASQPPTPAAHTRTRRSPCPV